MARDFKCFFFFLTFIYYWILGSFGDGLLFYSGGGGILISSFFFFLFHFHFFLWGVLEVALGVRRTRHAGHCWRSRDELIRDVLLWTPTHGRAKAGRPAWTYIQQLCEDTGCCPEDLPRAMNDREEWRAEGQRYPCYQRDMMMMMMMMKYIGFGWVGFYGISTIVGYLMPNPLYTYILNILDLVWLGFMAYQPL